MDVGRTFASAVYSLQPYAVKLLASSSDVVLSFNRACERHTRLDRAAEPRPIVTIRPIRKSRVQTAASLKPRNWPGDIVIISMSFVVALVFRHPIEWRSSDAVSSPSGNRRDEYLLTWSRVSAIQRPESTPACSSHCLVCVCQYGWRTRLYQSTWLALGVAVKAAEGDEQDEVISVSPNVETTSASDSRHTLLIMGGSTDNVPIQLIRTLDIPVSDKVDVIEGVLKTRRIEMSIDLHTIAFQYRSCLLASPPTHTVCPGILESLSVLCSNRP
jgi:hypothetical protein